jgi:hypothetical protein
MSESKQNRMKKAARFMARPDLFSFALLWLMTLLIVGTVSEKYMGLYLAQKMYFSSAVIWLWDWLPLPGVLSTVCFIFTGMMCKLALDRWHWRKTGTIIIHLGAALLLFGGFLTAQFSLEGNMMITEGGTSNYIESDHHVELAVVDLSKQGAEAETVFSESRLAAGGDLTAAGLPFTLHIESWCRNCGLLRLPAPVTNGNPHGVAINFVLRDMPRDPLEERNRSGLTFTLSGTGDRDGLYAIFQSMPIPEIVTIAGKKYLLDMRQVRSWLPFSIQLLKFHEDFYPGTDKPRGYQSDVVLRDGGVMWHSLIQMNEPLRYKGYTFYQASFAEGGPQTVSVLAVVKNIGRLFPYLSSITICIGMLIHLASRLPGLSRRSEEI